jgi:MFS family permease
VAKKCRKLTIITLVLAVAAFWLSSFTSCSHTHVVADCSLDPQRWIETLLGLAGYLLIITAIIGAAVGLTALFLNRERPRSFTYIIATLLLATIALTVAVPLLYHLVMEYIPSNPWNHVEDLPNYIAMTIVIFVLPGLALATFAAAITCSVFAYRNRP